MNRKERDRRLRRSDIFVAAEHVFALKGYRGATIRDIAKKAQYAIGTVYLYFRDKDELYMSLFADKLQDMLSVVEKKILSAEDARSKFELFVREFLAYFEENQNFFRMYVIEADNMMVAEKSIRNTQIGRKFEKYMEEIVEQAQKEGTISRDYDAQQVMDIFTAIMKTFVLKWFRQKKRGRGSLTEMSDIILKCLLNGVSAK